jgi:tetratricopeptide (TPR) repeat protein
MSTSFADLLGQHLAHTHNSVNRLAKISGVPQRTLANWLNGKIRKPQQWQAVVKAAIALQLTSIQTDALLCAAGHPSLAQIHLKVVSPGDQFLLANFPIAHQQSKINNSPFQAIAAPLTFVGREAEMDTIQRALKNNGRAAICGLHGMGGVGKTALAAHLADQLRGEYPDGVLWARLDTSDTLSILSAFADAYGKDVSHFADVESRAAVVRGLLAEKRTLLVLDNAETSAQVRPLLPANTSTCAVLITTRNDLSVTDGWTHLTVHPFDPASQDALRLFEKYLGRAITEENRSALLEIAASLGYLPLALAIAAGRLAQMVTLRMDDTVQHREAIAELQSALCAAHSRLDALARDDLSVRASLDVSYATLSAKLQAFFAALGIFGGDDFSVDVAAYVTEIPIRAAQVQLVTLASLSLAQASREGRWRLHPLLRDFAYEKLTKEHRSICEQTHHLMFEFYVNLVQSCPAEQQACLELEISNLWATLDAASQAGYETWLIRTALVLGNFLRQRYAPGRAEVYMHRAERAADAIGDDKSQAILLSRLGYLQWWQGKDPKPYYFQALELAKRTRQPDLECETLRLLGVSARIHENYEEAKHYYQNALDIAHQMEDTQTICALYNNLGSLLSHSGEFGDAEKYLQEALALSRKGGYTVQTISALQNAGYLYSLMNRFDTANAYLGEAANLARQTNRGDILLGIFGERADTALRQGNQALDVADMNARNSLEIARSMGFFQGESDALLRLGEIARRRKDFEAALGYFQAALTLSDNKNMQASKAETLYAIAQLMYEWGDHAVARTHAEMSWSIYHSLNPKQALKVQQWLASLLPTMQS